MISEVKHKLCGWFPLYPGDPVPPFAGVYALYEDGLLVYIGSALNLRSRRPTIPVGTVMKVSLSTRNGDWLMREWRLISRLNPPGNVRGRGFGFVRPTISDLAGLVARRLPDPISPDIVPLPFVADVLRAAESQNKSDLHIAARCDLHPATLGRWRNGSPPNVTALMRVAALVGMDIVAVKAGKGSKR